MLIYTSYFAQVKNLPSDIVPISIAAKQVPGWRYPVYKALAPTYNILYDYKRDGDKDHYVAAYLTVESIVTRNWSNRNCLSIYTGNYCLSFRVLILSYLRICLSLAGAWIRSTILA